MSELRYPSESKEYRDARDSLLKDEQNLVDKVKAVAEEPRKLPPSGQLKEDYVFQWATDGKVGKNVRFSELFADKNTLLLYSLQWPVMHVFRTFRRFRFRTGRSAATSWRNHAIISVR